MSAAFSLRIAGGCGQWERSCVRLHGRACETIQCEGVRKIATDCNNKGFYPQVKGKKRTIAEEITSPWFDGNITALCQRYSINRSTYYRWMREDAAFKGYCEWLIEEYTDAETAKAWRQLIKRIDKGDLDAISLFFKLKGKFVEKVDISGGVTIIGGENDLE